MLVSNYGWCGTQHPTSFMSKLCAQNRSIPGSAASANQACTTQRAPQSRQQPSKPSLYDVPGSTLPFSPFPGWETDETPNRLQPKPFTRDAYSKVIVTIVTMTLLSAPQRNCIICKPSSPQCCNQRRLRYYLVLF